MGVMRLAAPAHRVDAVGKPPVFNGAEQGNQLVPTTRNREGTAMTSAGSSTPPSNETITEHELAQCQHANQTGRTPVVFVHRLWLLPSSWDRGRPCSRTMATRP